MNDYEKIIQAAKKDSNIIGLILVGSRGKGLDNEFSDYDLNMIVRSNENGLKKLYNSRVLKNIDLSILSLKEFKKYADWYNEDGM